MFEVCKNVTTDTNNMWVFDRVCNYRRGVAWKLDQKDQSTAALKRVAREEMKWVPNCIIYDESSNVEEIQKTLDSITSQDWAPRLTTLILNSDLSKIDGIKILKDKVPAWKVVKIQDPEFGQEESVDSVVPKLEGNWVVVIYSGEELPKSFFRDVDRRLNDDMDRFVLLVDDGFYAISLTIFKLCGGNGSKDILGEVEGSVIDKVCWIANEERNPEMVRRTEDLYK
jgi:hypothetical protein